MAVVYRLTASAVRATGERSWPASRAGDVRTKTARIGSRMNATRAAVRTPTPTASGHRSRDATARGVPAWPTDAGPMGAPPSRRRRRSGGRRAEPRLPELGLGRLREDEPDETFGD